MGKVLVLCAGEQERWGKSVAPKQIVAVQNGEQLLSRTVRQIRKKMNNFPHVVSHQKCLRNYSRNYIVPTARRYICETLLSVALIWGSDWTMVLLGDVNYSDDLVNLMYVQRDKFKYHFYGNVSEIFGVTFTDNANIEQALFEVVRDADTGNSRGKLWELYYRLSGKPMNESDNGRIGVSNEIDSEHYTFINDGTRDFDTLEGYTEWIRAQMQIKR